MKTKVWTKETIRKELQHNLLEVTFTKTDNTERVMVCTLDKDMLPPQEKDVTMLPENPRNINENVICVFDVEAQDWRSFRINSIKEVVYV